MRCLFAVSSWFVERASSTVNIDLSDVTNKYYTVLYRTVVVYEKKNRSLVFSGDRKIPTRGPTVPVGNSASLVSHWNGGPSGWDFSVPTEHPPFQWETRQASFPTGTVGPQVGIFLSPLNTNAGFYLSYMTTWQLSYMDRVKYSFFPKNDIQRTNILRLSSPKTPSKGKRYLLTSYNVNYVTERAPRDDNGNVTLMAQVA